jgi:hypothetical protein
VEFALVHIKVPVQIEHLARLMHVKMLLKYVEDVLVTAILDQHVSEKRPT